MRSSPNVSATGFTGAPANRVLKPSDQATSNPQLADFSDAIATPRSLNGATQPPSAPSRDHDAPPQPSAQQRRSLEALWEDAPARADESLFAQALAPLAQSLGRESLDRRPQMRSRRAIARHETLQRFGMREIEPAASRHEEFPRRRWRMVEDQRRGAGFGQGLGGHQSGRAGADDERSAVAGIVHFFLASRRAPQDWRSQPGF
jgi:hypothetical protein